jgi:glutathione S-transferase
MKLYAMPKSGNCHKAAWMLHRLGLPYEMVVTSFVDGGTRSSAFLGKSLNGQVPLLELDSGRRIAQSNAILLYLSENYPSSTLLPQDPYERALTYQWLFFEQNNLEPAIAARHVNAVFQRPCSEETMRKLLERGYSALDVMERQLGNTPYLVGKEMTIADMALFAYTHVAHEVEYDMLRYPNIQDWMLRVQLSPRFCGIDILETKSNV